MRSGIILRDKRGRFIDLREIPIVHVVSMHEKTVLRLPPLQGYMQQLQESETIPMKPQKNTEPQGKPAPKQNSVKDINTPAPTNTKQKQMAVNKPLETHNQNVKKK